jgi:antitoxin component YwqK of YwqJK toxin-antitoxin module
LRKSCKALSLDNFTMVYKKGVNMKKILVFSLLLVLGTACRPGGETQSEELDLSSFTLEKIPGSAFQRAVRLENGKLLEEGLLHNGKKNGTWVVYHGDEKNFPKSIATYVDGILSGPFMEINNFGQFTIIAQYKDNKYDGRVAKYNFTRLAEEFHYKDGVLDGLYTSYYDGTEIKQRSAEFKNGVENGFVRFFDAQGNVTVEYQYKNGEKISGGMVSPPEKGN